MKVLVTGGAGFIGSHTVDLLVDKGYDVVVLDNLQPRVHPRGAPSWIPADVDFRHADVADRQSLASALEGADAVFHLAAYQDYMPDFSRFIHTNAESAALIFEIAVSDRTRYPVTKIVFASSQSVSGEGRYVCGTTPPGFTDVLPRAVPDDGDDGHGVFMPPPRTLAQLRRGEWEIVCPTCGRAARPVLIDEGTVNPGTSYAISKYAIELLADRLGRRYEIPSVCMRYTYVQGPRNSFYNAYSGVARRFALSLLGARRPTVFEDGLQLRDFVHVADVARANLCVLEDDRAEFGVFNVGGGRAYTVLEFAERMIEATGVDLEPDITGEFRLGDTRHTVSDNSRIEDLGWKPERAIEDNIRDYLEWLRPQVESSEHLEQADREMRASGVIQRARP